MTKRDYTQAFKEQILRECQEVGMLLLSPDGITSHRIPSIPGEVMECHGFAGHGET